MGQIMDQIRARRSVRSFDGLDLGPDLRARIRDFTAEIKNPYGIPVEFRMLDAMENGLSSPVISGCELYMGAKIRSGAHMEEAFGYSFERFVLYAQSLGLGTTWIGGTMDRKLFERAMALSPEERMPCVSPLGKPSAKMSLRETMMRKGVKADNRQPFEALFFEGGFDRPLTEARAGLLKTPLEAVRLAPSAVNRQPWRVVVMGDTVHFYEQKSRGYVSAATGDLQKVDLGIALCHFSLVAEEEGLAPSFALRDPGLSLKPDMEYIASYRLSL